MIEQVTKPTIGALLSPEESIMFKIPRYQREYTWGHRDWKTFLTTLWATERATSSAPS